MTGLLWLIATLAAVATFASTPIVRAVMIKRGVLDVPNHRSAHSDPVPRGGGIACALGIVSGAAVATLTGANVPWGAILASLALAGVGYLDDRLQLPVLPRLGAQVLVGAAVGAGVGGPVWAGLGALLVPVVVNVVNFMDGINGITSLTMILWGAAVTFAGLAHEGTGLSILGALTAAAAVGFLPWNAPRARVFLGDVGSYLFGALAATGMLVGSADGVSPILLAAPLAVYFTDAGMTLLVRMLHRAPLFEAHREHIFQKLVHDVGLPHLPVAVWASMIAASVVWAWSWGVTWLAIVLTLSALVLYLASAPLARAARKPKMQMDVASCGASK